MTPEAQVTQALKGSFSVLAQRGKGLAVRTNVAKGMIVGHKEYSVARNLGQQGRWEEAARILLRARAIDTGEEGFPDWLVFLAGGKLLPLEVKEPGGRVSEGQAAMHAKMRSLGFEAKVVRSRREFDEVAFPMAGEPVPRTVEDLVADAKASLVGWEPPF